MSTGGCQIPLASKFRGCLLGAVLGDCLGSPFEHNYEGPELEELQNFFDSIEKRDVKSRILRYTDDFAMAICIAESLLNRMCLDETDLARRFVTEFQSDQTRAREYGMHVRHVFYKLRDTGFADPMKPAKAQFDGTGSFGNGGAMRVAPVALFCHKDYDAMLHVAKRATQITHTHPLGVNGAILQCLAVHQALMLDPKNGHFNVHSFTEDLISKMMPIEEPDENGKRPYHNKLLAIKKLLKMEGGATLHAIKKLLKLEGGASKKQVQKELGNSIAALESVPTAIYSFLRAQEPVPGIKTNNKFQRTIQYAISLGGDTDTIATMAGAIAGAFFGEEEISASWKPRCEGAEKAVKLADELYDFAK